MTESPEPLQVIKVVGIGFIVVLTTVYLVVLPDALPGEIAAAIGAVLGGMIGAAGAVWAVQLTLSRQRAEETEKISSAVLTEVAAYAKYVIGALEICNQIRNHGLKVPRQDARYVMKNLWTDPTIYPAVADRVGLLPHPHATTEFYMRISEAKAMLEALRTKTVPQGIAYTATPIDYVEPVFASTVADSLITALQLATAILDNEGDASSRATLSRWVNATVADQIKQSLAGARTAFPDAESFADAVRVGDVGGPMPQR